MTGIKPHFKSIKKEIIKELKQALKSIYVAVCWFTNNEIFDVLCEKLLEGIPVKLIVLNDAVNNKLDGVNFQRFIDLGGEFYFSSVDNPMHNKYCIVDGRVLITGSYNWTYFAETKNNENILIIQDEVISRKFLLDFERLCKENKRVLNLLEEAILESQPISIVENMRIATDTDMIIKSKKEYENTQLYVSSSIGEVVYEDKFCVFIPKNTTVPFKKTDILYTVYDNQVECNTDIRFGENLIGSSNEQIGVFDIIEIPPMEKGKVGLHTTFLVDSFGILTIKILIKETNKITMQKFNIEHLLTTTIS